MKRFRRSLVTLLGLYLTLSGDHSGCCLNSDWQLPEPHITNLQADHDKQSLSVTWRVNHSSLVVDINEIQVSRSEDHTVIYRRNISTPYSNSQDNTWTWTSELPLQCVDHSVRIRYFYQHVPSPWSEWETNNGVDPEKETMAFALQKVLREGTSSTFCCVSSKGVNVTNMTINQSNYSVTNIGARVKVITVPYLIIPSNIFETTSVICSDTKNEPKYSWWKVISHPKKPTNLSCATSNMATIICTWDTAKSDKSQPKYILQIENSNQSPINCETASCTFAAIPQLEVYNISVVVKNQVWEEKESYSFNISERVVPALKWDKVTPRVTDISLSWIIQGNLTQRSFLCQATVEPGNDTELNCNAVNGTCYVKLEHLLPGTSYSVKVRCSANGRLWGKWTDLIQFKTYPLMTLNLWRTIKRSDSHSRHITLLWMLNTPESALTKEIRGYTVQWRQDGQNKTEWRDSAQTQADVFIGPGRYDFTVQAVFQTFAIAAHITLPESEDGEDRQVVTGMRSVAGGFNLSWTEQDTAICGYTVEWCILGDSEPCTLRWINMQKGNNTLFLPASNFNASCSYTFNIYGCTVNGHRLLEIKTGCSRELDAVHSLSLVVKPVQRTASSVTLEWHHREHICNATHSGFITGYLITVQEVESNVLPDTEVSDPLKHSLTIEGLKQNQKYTFSVKALTVAGPGKPTNVTIWTRTNYSDELVNVLTPILLLLVFTVLLWPRRRMLKEIFTYPAGMNIKTLEIDSFLQEVDECISCDIEILNAWLPLSEAPTLGDPEPPSVRSTPGSQSSLFPASASDAPPQDYCPQSATLLGEVAAARTTCITNKSYLYSAA
ncbi:oncostatin-M-specific receptor subunit beta isoform X2 [Echeneis naucrates]|uniref:oncostatin-M-specific receptor subunit beta isoform X2 n=1 Tax=Echeneis naucrates TaxID=173247 RepID=UPI001113C1FD|nr:oncostatin-M-specific receptor subunit beta-like isoform X2 [Echeneis naucrates]